MAKGIFYGAGQFGFVTNDGNPAQQLLVTEPLEFMVEGESNEVVAKGQRDGKTVITGSALAEENYKAKVKIEAISWRTLQIAYGLSAATSSGFSDPVVKRAKITSAGEITDPAILAIVSPAYLVPVQVSNPDKDFSYEEMPPATLQAALTDKQFTINRTTNKLTFATSQADEVVVYRLVSLLSIAETIGKESAVRRLNNVSFSAIGYGNGGTEHSKIIVPEMSRVSVPTLSMSGSQTSFDLEYRLIQTDQSDGLPFIMRKLH
jgi:hypothetical protein